MHRDVRIDAVGTLRGVNLDVGALAGSDLLISPVFDRAPLACFRI